MLVVLYAPVIVLRHWFWMAWSGTESLFGIWPFWSECAQTWLPYVRAALTTTSYNVLALLNVAPHVECVSFVSNYV